MLSPPANPKQDLRLTVSVAVAYDPTSRIYTYTYSVENEHQSGNALDVFGLAPLADPVEIGAPAHWAGDNRWEERLDSVVWSIVDDPNTQPTDTTRAWEIPITPYHPQPGTTLAGFVIKSRQPATTVSFYAQGYDTVLDVAEDEGEALPYANTLFTNGVTGTTLGPDKNSTVGINEDPSTEAREIEFRPPSPNPASHGVTISYYLPRSAKVQLAVHDVSGRRVRLLAEGQRPPGLHSVSWNGLGESGQRSNSGVYFTRLVVDGKRIGQQKITILK